MVVPAPSGKDERMRWNSFALTDRGLIRERNEDAFLLRPGARIYAVADGMGGHAAGDTASRLAVESLAAAFPRAPSPRIRSYALSQRLVDAFAAANRAILEHAARHRGCSGMGTTLTALAPLVAAPQCVIAHIGDSRAYQLRAGELRQVTTDHTWVQQQVDAGMLTPLQARHHPHASLLNRVLGTPAEGPADTMVVDTAAGDLFLLCSDGLTNMLDDGDLQALLHRELPLEQLGHDLVDAANAGGGRDNITILLLRVAP
jgi:PPM family protein phosphatase